MSIGTLTVYALAIVIGAIVVAALLRLVWLALGAYRINRAGPRPLVATAARASGAIPATSPRSTWSRTGRTRRRAGRPFRSSKSTRPDRSPASRSRDARGRLWRVKWGNEVRSENFAVRLAWACGYFAETTYFVAAGTIDGAADVCSARGPASATTAGSTDARFELDDPAVRSCSKSTAGRGTTIRSSARRSCTGSRCS